MPSRVVALMVGMRCLRCLVGKMVIDSWTIGKYDVGWFAIGTRMVGVCLPDDSKVIEYSWMTIWCWQVRKIRNDTRTIIPDLSFLPTSDGHSRVPDHLRIVFWNGNDFDTVRSEGNQEFVDGRQVFIGNLNKWSSGGASGGSTWVRM